MRRAQRKRGRNLRTLSGVSAPHPPDGMAVHDRGREINESRAAGRTPRLEQLLGEWTITSEDSTGSGEDSQPWIENVRSMHRLWVVCEGEGIMPGGSPARL